MFISHSSLCVNQGDVSFNGMDVYGLKSSKFTANVISLSCQDPGGRDKENRFEVLSLQSVFCDLSLKYSRFNLLMPGCHFKTAV